MRDRGTFNFSGNLEVKKDAPLEARSLVNSYADLVKPETWTDEQGSIWKYDCMLVSCKDRPGNIYQLSPGADYTKESSWILIGDTSELNNKVQQFINSKGAPNGLASLNESGIIPSAQLPSYVDDVIEVDTFSNLPGTGESGKIYIVQDTNLTYRWSGTDYVEISKSLALGETSSTAYPGDKGKATTDKVNAHTSDYNNPHKVTAEQVGLGNVDNTSDINKPVSTAQQEALDKLKSDLESIIGSTGTDLSAHLKDFDNPHKVTKDQVGLGNVDNTADKDKPISDATQKALDSIKTETNTIIETHIADKNNPHEVTKEQIGLGEVTNDAQVKRSEMGVAGGVATLDQEGKVPSSQLPSFVDDVIEVDSYDNLPTTGEAGKIYVTKDTNLTYRWSGSRYIEISASLALGETSSTAYPGDKGKETTDKVNTHVADLNNPHQVTKEQVGLGNVDNTSDANKPISNATQTALNGKFSATDGNALKQRVDNIPEWVASDITVDSDNDSVNISLDMTSIIDGSLSGTTININSATASKAGILVPTDKSKIDKIITNGNGTKYLSDNGTYKEVRGGSSSSDINIIELRDIMDIISIVYHEKDRASSDISSVFGGSANFRSIVNDILKTHTRYFFHVKDTPDTNCIQLSGVNAWKNIDNTQYELHFIYNYYISDGNQRTCRRVTVIDSDNTDRNLFIVENVNDMYVLSKDRDRRKSVSLVGEGFDENHWYPVSFIADPNSIVPPCNLIIWNSLNNDSAGISPKPSWATNNGGFTLHVNMSIIGSGWGQYANAKNKLNDYDGEWGGETAVGEMRQTVQTSTFYIYLRGGANYFYTSDYADLKMIAHSSEVLDGYNTYSIKDTQGDIKDFFTYVENDLFGEVENLQIVHDNEFNFANSSIGNYVWINYRSRYDTVTSAKAIYIGNGQAGADGAYGAVHASGFFKESDIRLKSDIAPLKHTLDQICNIPTVEFNMHDKHQIGTIAQDLENNFAEVVNTDSDGMKSVDYCMLGVVAIEGIKLLKQEVEDLKKQIEELKNGKQNN